MSAAGSSGLAAVRSGFTFLEILVALALLSVIAAALLTAHIRAMRAEQMARASAELRFVVAQAAVEGQIGGLPAAAVTNGLWTVETAGGLAAGGSWKKFRVSAVEQSGVHADVYVADPQSASGRP